MRQHSCDLCDAAFYSNTHLAQHVHKQHGSNWNGVTAPPQNLVGCVVCGQGFETSTKMLQHLLTHRVDGTASRSQILAELDKHIPVPPELETYVIQEEPS